MYIRTLSGKLIFIDENTESRLPNPADNYKYVSNDFYNRDRVKKQKLNKVYSPFSLQKILQENYNYQLINITGYKGNRYGYNTYRVLDEQGNKVIDGHLHDIAEWIEQKQGVQ